MLNEYIHDSFHRMKFIARIFCVKIVFLKFAQANDGLQRIPIKKLPYFRVWMRFLVAFESDSQKQLNGMLVTSNSISIGGKIHVDQHWWLQDFLVHFFPSFYQPETRFSVARETVQTNIIFDCNDLVYSFRWCVRHEVQKDRNKVLSTQSTCNTVELLNEQVSLYVLWVKFVGTSSSSSNGKKMWKESQSHKGSALNCWNRCLFHFGERKTFFSFI